MRTRYSFGFLAMVVMLGGVATAGPEDKILVPGDPALTQDMVDKDIDAWELELGLKLTAAQRKQFQQLRINDWKGAPKVWKEEYVKTHVIRVENAKLGTAERDRIRDEEQSRTLARMRGSPDDTFHRLLLPIYEGQVLVPGNPALTRGAFDKDLALADWLLDLGMTADQRKEYQQVFIAEWKKQTKARQAAILKDTANWYARVSNSSPADRAIERAVVLAENFEVFRASKAEDDKWLMAAYDAAHKPGSDTNPVLAKGDPPLTLDMLNDYFDYLEWSCDRTQLGGWAQGRLKAFQELITADWAEADAVGRDAFLADLKWWHEKFPKLANAAQRLDANIKRRPAYLIHLRKTAGDAAERRQFIARSDEDAVLEGKLEAQRHRAVMDAIGRIGGQTPTPTPGAATGGGYGYRYVNNPRTGQLEFKFGWK